MNKNNWDGNWYQKILEYNTTPHYLNIPMIIARTSQKLTIGKGILFKGEDKKVLKVLNDFYTHNKIYIKLLKAEYQSSLLGRAIFFLRKTQNGDYLFDVATPSFMSRVSKVNEIEQGAELFVMSDQSDRGALLHIRMTNKKMNIVYYNNKDEVSIGGNISKLLPTLKPDLEYSFDINIPYPPIVEMINIPFPLFFGNSSNLNANPDLYPVFNLLEDVEKNVRQRRVERTLNQTRMYGTIPLEQFKKNNSMNGDLAQFINDGYITGSTTNLAYNATGRNVSMDIVQGNPKFEEYNRDLEMLLKQIFEGAGYDYEIESRQYTNKTQLFLSGKNSVQTTFIKRELRLNALYRIFDYYLIEKGLMEYGDDRPYSMEFIDAGNEDKLRVHDIIEKEIKYGLISLNKAISRLENVDELQAQIRLEEIEKEIEKYPNIYGNIFGSNSQELSDNGYPQKEDSAKTSNTSGIGNRDNTSKAVNASGAK